MTPTQLRQPAGKPSRRNLLAWGAAATLSACAPRTQFVASSGRTPSLVRNVVLATNRGLDADGGLGNGRGADLRFAEIDVAIPEDRAIAASPFSEKGGFSVAGTRLIKSLSSLEDILAKGNSNDLTLWVHGFNMTPAEAVYRQAQMAEDYAMTGPQVAFVWASAERGVGYLHDRDSILHARMHFEQLIRLLARSSPGRITIVAHSLGSLLVMETLRQAAIAGRPLDPHLSSIVLIQPDIDMDVFRAQIQEMGQTTVPMALVIARDDPVLRLSARLSGRVRRLGSEDDLAVLRALGLIVIDVTNVEDASNAHFAAASSPSAIALIRGLRQHYPYERSATND